MPASRLRSAFDLIDAANAADPNSTVIDGASTPLAQAQGQKATEWLEQLVAHPSHELLISARAHHLRRWELPRSSYPEGRTGYLRWRTEQKDRQCRAIAEILDEVGYDTSFVERVHELIRLKGRSNEDEAQALEDASCLVFIETQLLYLSGTLERGHMEQVIKKTAGKMSELALGALNDSKLLDLNDEARALLREALS